MNYKLSTTTTSNNDSDQIQNDIVNYDGELLLNNNNNNRYKSVIDALVWPIVIRPLLYKIQKYNQNAAIILLHSLANAEHCQPGFLQQFCQMILSMNNIDSINMIESLLRLQANIPEADEQRCRRTEQPFQNLNHCTIQLKRIVAQIPNVIYNRQLFLDTIRKIAAAIKELLDCIYQINSNGFIVNIKDRRLLDNCRREFIRDSKQFSQSLKDYIKNGDEKP
ncbi:Programmed cell death protein 10, partial [Dermatophagoides pteronyssinus]